ncbi:MAG TPA: efflux RND transporter periplasmic adaptor subunit, partial [Methylocystis sp.]
SARRALARAQAQVQRAEAEVAQRREAAAKAEAGRAGAEVKAPVAGFIVERRAAVGARVVAGVPLFVIADAQRVRLNARAEGKEALAIVPGANVLLSNPAAPERTFAGKVVEARRQSQESAVVDVVIEASNPDLALRPGMEASARIEIAESEAALQP